MKRTVRYGRLWLLLLVGGLLILAAAPIAQAESATASSAAQTAPTAVVATGALNVRSGPGIAYGRTAVVYRGQVLTLLGRNAESSWVKVRLYTGLEGWVNASLVSLSVPISQLAVTGSQSTPTADAVVNTGALNVRSGPDLFYRSLHIVYQGERVQLLGRDPATGWVQIRTSGGTVGWVNPHYLRTAINIWNLPTVVPDPKQPESTQALATVTAYALNVRSGPSTAYGVLEVAYRGHVLALLGRNGDASWLHVRTFTGLLGWVRSTEVQANIDIWTLGQVQGPAAHTAIVTAGALNVRYGPHPTYGAFAVIYRGQQVILLGRSSVGGWAQVRLPSGAVGWVNGTYLQSSTPFNNLPVTG